MLPKGIIIGAGIVGSAVAYELSRRGAAELRVIDADLEGSLSSTERNAGGVRHLWSQTINVQLAQASIALFSQIGDEIGFQRSGYLWLYDSNGLEASKKMLAHMQKHGLEYEWLGLTEIAKRYSFINKLEGVSGALYGKNDGLINSNALKQWFQKEAKKKGVTFIDRTWAQEIVETGAGKVRLKYATLASQEEAQAHLKKPVDRPQDQPERQLAYLDADFVIICAGAWSQVLLTDLVSDPLIRPVRRQICLFKAEGINLNAYGMVVDTSRVYFHPEGGNILAGLVLKDEPEGFRLGYDESFFMDHIWPALYERSSYFEKLKPITGWGGLYSYTPDTSGILGKVPGFHSVYECHSFTGRGVMQSYGAAFVLSDLITSGAFTKIDGSCLSRERFKQPESTWLFEDLHI